MATEIISPSPLKTYDRYDPPGYSFAKTCTYAVCTVSTVVGLLFITLSTSGVFGSLKGIGAIAALGGGATLCIMSAIAIVLWLIYMYREQPQEEDASIPDVVFDEEFGIINTNNVINPNNAHDTNGHALIHREAMRGNTEAVINLVRDQGVDVNLTDTRRHTALHFAVLLGNVKMVKCLLGLGANVNAQDFSNKTPMLYAVRHDKREIIKLLSEAGAKGYGKIKSVIDSIGEVDKSNLGRSCLHWAVNWGDEEAVDELLVSDCQINFQDKHLQTPLHLAAIEGDEALVKKLLRARADVTIKDQWGRTALHWAAKKGCLEVVQMLVEQNGELINEGDGQKQTPLHLAVWWNKSPETCALFLINPMTDVKIANYEKQTALHLAARRGKTESAEKIIHFLTTEKNKLEEINRQDKFGRTALHWAAERNEYKISSTLHSHEASLTCKDSQGKMPHELSTEKSIKSLLDPSEKVPSSEEKKPPTGEGTIPQDEKKGDEPPKEPINQDIH